MSDKITLPEPQVDAWPEDPPFLFEGRTVAPYCIISYRLPTKEQYANDILPQFKVRGLFSSLQAAEEAASSGTLYEIDPYDAMVLTETGKWLVAQHPDSQEKIYTNPEQAAWSRDFEQVQKEAREASLKMREQRKIEGDRLVHAVENSDMDIIDQKLKEITDQIKDLKQVYRTHFETKKAIVAKQQALLQDPLSKDKDLASVLSLDK